jgi:dienelactone hydrolase
MASPTDTEAVVREFVARFVDWSFADAADLTTEDGREAVVEACPGASREEMTAEDALESYRWGLRSKYGDFEEVGDVTFDADGARATVTLGFEGGTETVRVGVDDGITDLSISSAYEAPEYVDEDAFSEREVTVDAGGVDLDGVLTVPDGPGPFPGVVLVHGAGVHDPDGTAGASKLLKDLAWGLASAGVAAHRYEKRLAEHDVADENRTLDTVVVDDAVAAVDALAATDDVADDAVFVAGHSQGGMAAPRIADHHGGVAGVVVLDGRAETTHDPDDVPFLRYEMEHDGELDEDQEEQLERERETVRRLAEGDYDDDETLWGRPGTWHRSLLNYDPAGTASGLDAPVFVLKTGRADEETRADLAGWMRGEYEAWRDTELPDGSRVEFYESLDHYLQDGFTPAHPMSVELGGNVADSVVRDLAEWIQRVAP